MSSTHSGIQYPWLMTWLKENQSDKVSHRITIIQCVIAFNIFTQKFYHLFAKQGYTEKWYVSEMTKEVSCPCHICITASGL